MKNKYIYVSYLFLGICSMVFSAEYPIITNNYNLDPPTRVDGVPDDGVVATNIPKQYILIRNQLHDLNVEGFLVSPYENSDEVWDIDVTSAVEQPYLDYNNSPRNFLGGEYDVAVNKFTWIKPKFILPRLDVLPGITRLNFVEDYLDNDTYRVGNMFQIDDIPWVMREQENDGIGQNSTKQKNQNIWQAQKQYHFKLSPAPEVIIFPLEDLGEEEKIHRDSNAPNSVVVQGQYSLGGAIVCGRKENGQLVLYRFPAYQRTLDQPIQVFDPKQKLTWDEVKSNADHLAAFTGLRPDLLEHNTGLTENKIFVRMQPHTVKLDKPNETKAMRDWYILAPFYDPVTQTYRETLQASDFVGSGTFDPNAADFDPSKFVKKFVPYQLPADYWSRPESGTE